MLQLALPSTEVCLGQTQKGTQLTAAGRHTEPDMVRDLLAGVRTARYYCCQCVAALAVLSFYELLYVVMSIQNVSSRYDMIVESKDERHGFRRFRKSPGSLALRSRTCRTHWRSAGHFALLPLLPPVLRNVAG